MELTKELNGKIERCKKLFGIDIPVSVRRAAMGGDVEYFPDEGRAVLVLGEGPEGSLADSFARIRLGLDGHPLLATMRFQPGYTPPEATLIQHFTTITKPVMIAWIFLTMKRHLGADEFALEVGDMKKLLRLMERRLDQAGESVSGVDRMYTLLPVRVVLYAVGESGDDAFAMPERIHDAEKATMLHYIDVIKKYIAIEPGAEALIHMANELGIRYSVSVVNAPRPYFDVRESDYVQ